MNLKSNVLRILPLLLTVAFFSISITACSKSNEKTIKSNEKTIETNANPSTIDSINIKYVGNSCFYITLSDGTRIITDPYGSKYSSTFNVFPSLEADIMTISHTHDDHIAGISEVKGNPKAITSIDINKPIKIGSVEITGYKTNHVANNGDNTVFVMKAGNFKIVNMGETDTIDSPDLLEAVQNADVVLAYAGEYGAVKNKYLFNFLDTINAKVVIPEHYSMNPNNIFYGEPTIDKILEELPENAKVSTLDELVVKDGLEKQFVVLSPMKN